MSERTNVVHREMKCTVHWLCALCTWSWHRYTIWIYFESSHTHSTDCEAMQLRTILYHNHNHTYEHTKHRQANSFTCHAIETELTNWWAIIWSIYKQVLTLAYLTHHVVVPMYSDTFLLLQYTDYCQCHSIPPKRKYTLLMQAHVDCMQPHTHSHTHSHWIHLRLLYSNIRNAKCE